MIATKKLLSVLFTGALAASASAADYYVASDGTYEGAPEGATVYTTIDEAIAAAGNADDVIYVETGTYMTSTQYGPNLKAKLVGAGSVRDDVTIQSSESYRTLRMAAGSWLENVTVVGNTNISKADKGGAIEMNGGTITNCVLRDGKTYGNGNKYSGGNLYVNNDAALVVDCVISGGEGKNHGGNVCLVKGTIRACTITGGITYNDGEKYGANIWMSGGLVDSCTVSGGDGYEGGEIYMTGGTVTNCTILANGVTRGSGGGIYMTGGTVTDCSIDGTGGTMSWHGGCIYMKNGTVRNTTCQNGTCTFANNRLGGNVYMENGTLQNVTLRNGTAGDKGGNLYVKVGTINGLTCEDGIATGNGGNVYMEGAATIVGGVIRRGTATSKGGNIYMGDGMLQDLEISGGVLTGNVTDGEGGGNIFWNNGRISRCSITGGKLTGTDALRGGGINCVYTTNDNVTRVLEDCLLSENENAAIFCNRDFAAYNCSFVNNAGASVNSWRAITLDFHNCVIFGNTSSTGVTHAWTGNRPVIKNVATDDTSLSNTDGYVAITASAFADYTNGDYRPAADGALVDAGIADVRVDASDKDLDGKPRLSEGVDIGCYEYQHSNMTVSFTAPAFDVGYAPATATFTASAENAPGEVSYEVDFGDGTLEVYTESQISHVYTAIGTYTISVTAVSGVERSKPMTRTVKIVDKIQRVGEGGHSTIQEALDEAVAGCEVILAAGVYEVSSPIVVNKAVTVSGEGSVLVRNTAEATSDSANHRVMEVSGGALVTGLVIENGSVFNGYGGCIDVSAATVSNCVIRGGAVTRGDTGTVGGGGVSLRSNAVLTHCHVTNNVVIGTSTGNGDNAGGAIFIHNNNKPVRILNTLVAGNRYVCTEGADAKSGSAGIFFGGANENSLVENCTIVANTVEGALSSDSAGLYCTSWSAVFRNNVIAGNFETAKGESGTYTSARIDTAHCTVVYCVTDDAEPLKASCSVSTVDEMFKNFAKGDYSPKPKGALFDVGTTPSVLSAVDLTGKPRVMFAGIDVGCFECQRMLGFSVIIR